MSISHHHGSRRTRRRGSYLTGILPGVFAACILCLGCAEITTTTPTSTTVPQPIVSKHLQNALRIHEKVISGGAPEDETAFRELQKLGVKTIVTVDGAQPDVETAARFGMRYVHLPHGYDGISEVRAKELAKAVRDLPGPIYIHCHHGKHRSPAAAAVACVGAGLIEPNAALPILAAAGTSKNYQGLYQSAKQARRLEDAILDELFVEFPAKVAVPPLAEAMVEIEHTHDHLKLVANVGWNSLATHPDIDPAHEALLLREHFTELLRTGEVQRRPEPFRKILHESEQAAADLEAALRQWQARGKAAVTSKVASAFERITQNCAACHGQFRDTPLEEGWAALEK